MYKDYYFHSPEWITFLSLVHVLSFFFFHLVVCVSTLSFRSTDKQTNKKQKMGNGLRKTEPAYEDLTDHTYDGWSPMKYYDDGDLYIAAVHYQGKSFHSTYEADDVRSTQAMVKHLSHQLPKREFVLSVVNPNTSTFYHPQPSEPIYQMGRNIYVIDRGPKQKVPRSAASKAPSMKENGTGTNHKTTGSVELSSIITAASAVAAVAPVPSPSPSPSVDIKHATPSAPKINGSTPPPPATTTTECKICKYIHTTNAGRDSRLIYEDENWSVIIRPDEFENFWGMCTVYTKQHVTFEAGKPVSEEFIRLTPSLYELINLISTTYYHIWQMSCMDVITHCGNPAIRDRIIEAKRSQTATTTPKATGHISIDLLPRYANALIFDRRVHKDTQWGQRLNLNRKKVKMDRSSQLKFKQQVCENLSLVLALQHKAVPEVTKYNAGLNIQPKHETLSTPVLAVASAATATTTTNAESNPSVIIEISSSLKPQLPLPPSLPHPPLLAPPPNDTAAQRTVLADPNPTRPLPNIAEFSYF